MGELWLSDYMSAPRGLASNTGFEDEDLDRARRNAQNELNSQYLRAKREVEKLAALLWKQEKLRVKSNETDAINRIVDDVEMVMHEHAKDGVLPKDNVLP